MNIYFTFIILIITILFIVLYSSNLEKFSNHMYRLGDMFSIKDGQNSSNNKEIGFDYHLKKFPNSIATEYMLSTNMKNNYQVLLDIIKKRTNLNNLRFKNYCVIHLRIGDVIDEDPRSVDKILSVYTLFNQKYNYVKPLSYYKKVSKILKDRNIKNILLVGGFHKRGSHSKSMEYVSKLKKFFHKEGFNCKVRINNNPDDDFLIMCNSKYFVPSGGGFSNIIKNIVKLKKNNVIE